MSEEVDYVEDEGLYDYDEAEAEVGQQQVEGDADIAEMEARIRELSEEQEQVNKMQNDVEKQISSAAGGIEENSVYIGQVDYEATVEELRAHFAACGTIHRVTILCDKFTGNAKGFAYIEFVDKQSVENALKLDDTPFKGRQLKVCDPTACIFNILSSKFRYLLQVLPKRQNEPKFVRGGRGGRGRGRGFRGGRGAGRRGGFRGGWGGGRGRGYY
jgi:polyadenylate-binding protein 2